MSDARQRAGQAWFARPDDQPPQWSRRRDLLDRIQSRRECGWFYATWWQDWRMRRDLRREGYDV